MSKSIGCVLLFTCLWITAAQAQTPDYVGRWYVGDASVCKKKTGEAEGLLVYTAREFIGYESKCRITKTAPQGRATALTLRCRAEGETYDESETVEVVQGRLRRIVLVEGKRTTFSYVRCPG
jgi:hypothetical protein